MMLFKRCMPIVLALIASTVTSAEPKSEPFGKTADGKPVELYTLTNETGLTAKIMTRGATLVQLHVPDKSGKTADVVLGFDSVAVTSPKITSTSVARLVAFAIA